MAETNLLCVHRGLGGGDDKLYSICATIQHNGDVTWGTKSGMGRATHGSAGPALVLYQGKIWCVYPTPAGVLKYTTWDPEAGSWTTDQDVGGNLSDATVALVVFRDRLFCLHRGLDDEQLYWCTNDGRGWSEDHFLADVKSASGPGAVVFGGRMFVLLRGRPPAHLLQGSTFITTGSGADGYWTAAYGLDFSGKQPYTDGRPAPIVVRGRLYCVHADANTRLAVCTLTVKAVPGQDPILEVADPDNTNGDYKAGAGPAVAVTQSHDEPTPKSILWALYRANQDAGNLYFAYWQPGSSWDAGRWAREANIVGNELSGEPAVLAVDNAVLRCCTGAAGKASPSAKPRAAAKKPSAKKPPAKKKAAKKKGKKKAKPKRVAAKRRAPVRGRKAAKKKKPKKR